MELRQRPDTSLRWPRTLLTTAALPVALLISLVGSPTSLRAQDNNSVQNPSVILPLVHCWYKGKVAYYIQTDASDQSYASQQGVNLVPRLSNAIAGGAVDDIYKVTNFNQGNVIPSAPIPAGPGNTDPDYTPLWQVSLVTWRSGTTPYTLKSEEEVLNAQSQGLVDIVKTNIIVNFPVIFTPYGGRLPTAKIIADYKDHKDNDNSC
jgi:hypothetical protein